MEALLCYCKIEVNKGDKESAYKEISAKDLEGELKTNHQLIKMTNGREDGESSGSDSEPSADNLEEEELAQVVPIVKTKPVKKVPPPAPPKPKPEPPKPKPPPPKSPDEKKREVIKQIVRSPDKKKGFNAFDRLSIRGKRKPEMKDAWTQTTPRARDERRAKRHAAQREAAL